MSHHHRDGGSSTDQIRALAENIQKEAAQIVTLLPEPPDLVVKVPAGGNLQAALDAGGAVALEPGATYPGNYRLTVAGTRLLGDRSTLHGPKGGAALTIPPGTRDVQAVIGTATCDHDQAVIDIGANTDAQTTADDCPRDVQLTITIPTFRGKRAFAIHGINVVLEQCNCYDVWDPAGRDSQGIWICNTPGPVRVSGGHFEAGSENVLIGGDTTKIAGVNVADVIVEDVELVKPLSWKDDGTNRVIKNNFELKDGVGIVLRRAWLDGCWTQAQQGQSIVVTPRNGKKIENVLVEDVTLINVGSVLNMLGYDDTKPSGQTVGVTLRRVHGTAQSGTFGDGRFGMWCGGPQDVTLEDCTFDGPGQCVYSYQGTIWTDGVKGKSIETRGCRILRNTFRCDSYGIMAPDAYGANWTRCFPDGQISGNTFKGSTASRLKPNLPPDNTYIA